MRRGLLGHTALVLGIGLATTALPVLAAAPASAAPLAAGSAYTLEYLQTSGFSASSSAKSFTRTHVSAIEPVFGGAMVDGFRLSGTESMSAAGDDLRFAPHVQLEAGRKYDATYSGPSDGIGFGIWTSVCFTGPGTVAVATADYDINGKLAAFAGSYDVECNSGRLRGQIRWNNGSAYSAAQVASFSFGLRALNTPHEATISVRSAGTSALTFAGSAAFTGPGAAAFTVAGNGCAGISLVPGDTCEVTISFTPTARQNYGAGLRLSAPGHPGDVVTVAVIGFGQVPPDAPSLLRAYPGTDGIGLAWVLGGTTQATGYRVYRSLSGEAWAEVAAPVGPQWFDTTVPAGVSAAYEVSAVNQGGESPHSAVATATPLSTLPTVGTTTALTWDVAGGSSTGIPRSSVGRAYSGTQVAPPVKLGVDRTRFTVSSPSGDDSLEVGRVPAPGTYATTSQVGADSVVLVTSTGCGYPGSLVVRQVAYDAAGTLLTMDASWRLDPSCVAEQHGEIRYNATSGYRALGPSTDLTWTADKLRAGTSSPNHRFGITNLGSQSVTLAEAVTSSPSRWPIRANTCSGTTLPPLASCHVDVAFSPSEAGDWVDTLRVADGTAAGARVFSLRGAAGTTPGAATIATVRAGGARAWITYVQPADWGNEEIHDFVLYRGTTSTNLAPVTAVTATNYGETLVDNGRTPGARYYYAVAARNRHGLGPRSPAVAVDVPTDEVLYLGGSSLEYGNLYVRPPDGGEAISLTASDLLTPALSPSGQEVAYSAVASVFGTLTSKIFIRRVDGTGTPRQLDYTSGGEWHPAWSPDGRRIAFSRMGVTDSSTPNSVAWVASGGGTPTVIPDSTTLTDPAFTPDGQSLVAVDVGTDGLAVPRLVRIDLTGSNKEDVPGGAGGVEPAIARDGSIAFARPNRAPYFRWIGTLNVLAPGSTVASTLTGVDAASAVPSWSPDGELIYFAYGGPWQGESLGNWNVASIDPDDPNSMRVLGPGVNPISRVADTTGPVIELTNLVTNLGKGTLTSTFTVADAITPAVGLTIRCAMEGRLPTPCVSSFAAGKLGLGRHTFEVTAEDTAGNVTTLARSFYFDQTPPVAGIRAPTSGVTMAESTTARVVASDESSGITDYAMRYRTIDLDGTAAWSYPSAWQALQVRDVSLPVAPGKEYCFSGRGRDGAGNWSPWTKEACTAVPLDDRSLAVSAGWVRATSSSAWQRTLMTATSKGRELRVPTLRGESVGVVALRCPACGAVDVFVDGERKARLSLKSAVVRERSVMWLPAIGSGAHRVVLRTVDGKRVSVDGVVSVH